MFLRNFYNALAYNTLGASTGSTYGDGSLMVTSSYENLSPSYLSGVMNNMQQITAVLGSSDNFTGYRYAFGSSNTAVSYDSAGMSSNSLVRTLSGSNFSHSTPVYDSATNKYSGSCSFLLSNTGSDSVTLYKVALLNSVYFNGSYSKIYFYAELLENPITLASGETVTYTHNFEFTMPTIT